MGGGWYPGVNKSSAIAIMANDDEASLDMESVAHEIAARVGEQLPAVILELLRSGFDVGSEPLQFECTLASNSCMAGERVTKRKITSLDIDGSVSNSPTGSQTPIKVRRIESLVEDARSLHSELANIPGHGCRRNPPSSSESAEDSEDGLPKPRRATGSLRVSTSSRSGVLPQVIPQKQELEVSRSPLRMKRASEIPAIHTSTLEKFVNGIWESIYSSVSMNPTEIIEQWQAIESTGQPRLLKDADNELNLRGRTTASFVFGRMNVLARKISQTSRACRSLEVIVQAYWIQCFDDRVAELARYLPPEKAKKSAITEACVDFNWTEKELRNKMGIWRGYHDIQKHGGWAALVFAGMGLYRFCKYRVAFTQETFQKLQTLRHRFEVASDTLHPHWRQLLGIIGGPTDRKYTGHPHDWVVGDPTNEALPLAETYRQWDNNFTYEHLEESIVDEEAWGQYDPRTVHPSYSPNAYVCQLCNEHQSDDPRENACKCFSNLYGSTRANFVPVQIFRTGSGKNNGLLACCPFEEGAAIGEFVGQITSGLANLDVMVGQTEKATYQIWQAGYP